MSIAGTVGKGLFWGLQGLMALDMLKGMGDFGVFDGAGWSRTNKENLAQLAEVKWGADVDAMDATQDVAEHRLTGKLAELAGFAKGGRMPAGVLEMQDQRHIAEMGKLYRNELSRSAVDSYPTLAELAAKTNLL